MKLLTSIPVTKKKSDLINYNSKVLLLGSCFSENIGNKLSYYKFNSLQNPFGILFQPKAIENLMIRSINNEKYTLDDLVFQNERWHCLDAHSSLSSSEKDQLLSRLNSSLTATKNELKKASHIIITLGTAWVYRYIETDKIVANCHKIPQKKFLKDVLSVNNITECLDAIVALIKSLNTKASIIFTVSPVRHLKDGFIENTRSKSHLIAGVHNVVDLRKNINYFPSYEIILDELRDYRFFSEDMIHPNNIAINYVWEKFSNHFFSDETLKIMKEVDVIQKALSHRPFNIKSKEYQEFLRTTSIKKEKIKNLFPNIEF